MSMSSARLSARHLPLLATLTFCALHFGCSLIGTCIARGMRVETPQGLRPIETLCVGDEVYCFDPTTGERVVARITRAVSAIKECSRLHLSEGRSLMLTASHPLYDPHQDAYFPASDWITGNRKDVMMLHSGGEGLASHAVEEVNMFVALAEVFTLTVDHPLHNFVVEGMLVHNKDEPFDDPCAMDSAELEERVFGDVAVGSRHVLDDEREMYRFVTVCASYSVLQVDNEGLKEGRYIYKAVAPGSVRVLYERTSPDDGALFYAPFEVKEVADVSFTQGDAMTTVRQLAVRSGETYTFAYRGFDAQGEQLLLTGLRPTLLLWELESAFEDRPHFTVNVDIAAETVTVMVGDISKPLRFVASPNSMLSGELLVLEPVL